MPAEVGRGGRALVPAAFSWAFPTGPVARIHNNHKKEKQQKAKTNVKTRTDQLRFHATRAHERYGYSDLAPAAGEGLLESLTAGAVLGRASARSAAGCGAAAQPHATLSLLCHPSHN